MISVRKRSCLRQWFSRFGSLLLLLQRSPVIQLIFPEVKLLGGAGLADTATFAIATVVGLGTFDAVSGATTTSITQLVPTPVTNPVVATTGTLLTFTVLYSDPLNGTPGSWQLVNTSGTTNPPASIPPGLTQSSSGKNFTLKGTPTTTGTYSFQIKAWEFAGNTGTYFVSNTFTISVTTPTPPGITTNPSSVTINSGATTPLNVIATGTAPLTYKWYRGLSGDTSILLQSSGTSSFNTPSRTITTNYWVNVSNSVSPAGVNSTTATVSIAAPPAISTHPASMTINSGSAAVLDVTATGTDPLTYKWYQGLAGDTTNPVQTGNTSSFTSPPLTASANYWVNVSNSVNLTGVNSTAAAVTVRNPFDSWMNLTGTGVPSNLTGPLNVPQGDGVCNLLKFAFKLDPNKPDIRRLSVGANDAAGLPGSVLVAGKLRLEFIRRKATTNPGITYTPQFCSDPSSWTDAPILNTPTTIDTTWERVLVDDPAPAGFRRFGRVVVMQAP